MSNKKYFILNGYPRSGKDTFKSIVSKANTVYCISTVDVVKKICKELGWDGVKDEKGRKALSDFKDLSVKHFDHSYNYVKSNLEIFQKSNVDFFFVDVREPSEIERLVNDLGFKTIFIDNKRVMSDFSNHADKNVESFNYDYTIDNNGSLEKFEENINKFIQNLK